MRMIQAIFIVAIGCIVSFAQQSAAQQTANQPQAKEQAVSPTTENPTLPEKKLTPFEVTQIQIRLSEALNQPNQSLSVDAEKLRSQGIEVVPGTRLVIKDGAIYLALTNDTLVPMTGGGASGCVPGNSKAVGQIIFIAPKANLNQPPAKDQTKQN
jgi:hypothetical protein